MLQWLASINIVLRGRHTDNLLLSTRAVVASLDPEVPIFGARTLDDDVASLVAGPRFVASVLSAFAVVALAIAAIGVYGVTSYAVAQRTREVGIRMALGATRSQVMAGMLREGAIVIGVGVAIGMLAAIWASQTLTGVMPEAPPVSADALAPVSLVLAAAASLAAYLPARRATRVSAVEALRQE